MQSLDVIEVVDSMIPDLVDESELANITYFSNLKIDVMNSGWFQSMIDNGGVLTAIGLTILMIPDPLVYGIGHSFGGPMGGAIALVIVNGVGIGFILIDQII